MNFLVAFMCDEMVKLNDMKETQENKVMLELSTEVIKTKIFFQKNFACCRKKKNTILGCFYIVIEKTEAMGGEVGASVKFDQLMKKIEELHTDITDLEFDKGNSLEK
jgi:hypothetical protein